MEYVWQKQKFDKLVVVKSLRNVCTAGAVVPTLHNRGTLCAQMPCLINILFLFCEFPINANLVVTTTKPNTLHFLHMCSFLQSAGKLIKFAY